MTDIDGGVDLRPWTDADLPLLRRLVGDSAMMAHLGGPETEEQILGRHERYLAMADGRSGRPLVVTSGADAVGWVGYWESSWHDEPIWEIGWAIVPEQQGKGIATAGAALAIERATQDGRFRHMHAYPGVDNVPSNRVCERLGFMLVATADVEYPKAHWMRCNVWRRELR
jgi:RimJ/RimL family protein N-acetyltransferase